MRADVVPDAALPHYHFTEALGISRYSLYKQDYGGPVGFRMASAHPDRVESLVVQDAAFLSQPGHAEDWRPFAAFPPSVRLAVLVGQLTGSRTIGA